jgi:hypothetical protein
MITRYYSRACCLSLLVLALGFVTRDHGVNGFLLVPTDIASGTISSRGGSPQSALFAAVNQHARDEDDGDEEEDLITKEMFYRELMGLTGEENERTGSKAKKKKKKRRHHDNRDRLPFLVQVIAPPEKAYEKKLSQQSTDKKNNKSKGRSSSDSDVVTETLGEFQFDKTTNCGDKIEIDNELYVVRKSKCQYKYAGAKKFVMVRKILQVKPVQRAMQEDYLTRQWNASPKSDLE